MLPLYSPEKAPVVLIADDDEDLLMLVKTQLQKEGFKVKLSHNGNNILRIAEEENVDIILLDVTMDGIDGKDICRMLKAHKVTSSIPVILFSGNDALDTIAMSCGADGFVSKPFEAALVKKKIMDTLLK
ncbi:MAG: response regulator [Agriterribacter sp.]